MMKKIIRIIGILLIILPIKVNALTATISVSCDKTKIAPGDSTTCRITGNTSGKIAGFSSAIEVGEGLTLGTITKDSIWEGEGSNGTMDLYTSDDKTGKFNIASFTVTASSSITNGKDVTIKIKNASATDVDNNFNDQSLSDASTSIRIMSTVNTLSSLSASGATISFNANTTTYNVTIDAASTTISAKATDSKASVSGTGTKTLNYGTNTFKVTVKSESGSDKVYTINVTRPDNRSKDNSLSSLKLSKGDIKFNKDTLTYNLDVKNDVTSIKIEATLSDSKASFVENYGPRTVDLKEGENTIEIKVKAENGSEKVYTIKITRAKKENNSNSGSASFSSGTKNDKSEDNITSSPKTGDVAIIIVLIVLIISFAGIFLFLWKRKKDEKKDNNSDLPSNFNSN